MVPTKSPLALLTGATEKVLSAVQTIAAISLEDGMEFDSNGATAETIREEDSYSGGELFYAARPRER